MSKASSVVASVMQQSRQSVPRSQTEYRKRPKATRPHEFRRYDGTTSWWPAAERRWRLCDISETGAQSAARYYLNAVRQKPALYCRYEHNIRTLLLHQSNCLTLNSAAFFRYSHSWHTH